MSDKKLYKTTDKAGFWVANKKIPPVMKDGKLAPMVGYELRLTDGEAKYELKAETIIPAEAVEAAPKKPSKGV